MNKYLLIIAIIVTSMLAMPVLAADKKLRHFMFIGQPNAAAWQYMMENPADRKAEVSGAFKALGGKVLSYYWGLGDGKNYITVTIPDDNELVQAIYLMRMPSGIDTTNQRIDELSVDVVTNADEIEALNTTLETCCDFRYDWPSPSAFHE